MITQLGTSENGDRDLATGAIVFNQTADATYARFCQGVIYLGDGVKNLDGAGGTFTLRVCLANRGGQDEAPVLIAGTTQGNIFTRPFPVPANTNVKFLLGSPNAADTDVDVTAMLFDVGADNVSIAAILTDTGTTLDGKLNAIAGYVDTEVAAIVLALATLETKIDTITELAEDMEGGDAIENFIEKSIKFGIPLF